MLTIILFINVCVAHEFRRQYYSFLNTFATNENTDSVIPYFGHVAVTEDTEPMDLINRKRYKPLWSDLDTRPLPEWFDKAKIGIMVQWGLFSVPDFEFNNKWFWENWTQTHNMHLLDLAVANYSPGYTYQEFLPMFTAELYEPKRWAELFANSGAKYVILTAKHHDSFTLFPSNTSKNWNAVEVGPRRDLVGDLAKAVKALGLEFGVYYSLYEWYNPTLQSNITLHDNGRCNKLWHEIEQLIIDYEPSVLWIDGKFEHKCKYWKSTVLLAWLYSASPVRDKIVVNDRWDESICKHGDFDTCYEKPRPGNLRQRKWENAFSLDRQSWSYRRNTKNSDVIKTEDIIKTIVKTVSCGGNVLLSLGPSRKGTIGAIFKERLLELGRWLGINGEAIYGTSPWFTQRDSFNSHVWYTCAKTEHNPFPLSASAKRPNSVKSIYAFILEWPLKDILKVKSIGVVLRKGGINISMLGHSNFLYEWKTINNFVYIKLPEQREVNFAYVWTLKFERY